jgi:hypothetical protein
MVSFYVLGVLFFGGLIWAIIYLLSNSIPKMSVKNVLKKMYENDDIDQETYIKYTKDL